MKFHLIQDLVSLGFVALCAVLFVVWGNSAIKRLPLKPSKDFLEGVCAGATQASYEGTTPAGEAKAIKETLATFGYICETIKGAE
jgi:hypothetical protein